MARPAPSLARAVAAAGAVLAALALAALGVDIVLDGGGRAGVAFLFLLYAAGGWLLVVFGAPSQRTAGVAAVALAVPAVLGFAVIERGGYSPSDTTATLALSTVVWAVLHVAGPTRGHGLLLGAALLGAWGTVMLGTDAPAVLDPPTFGTPPGTTGPAVASFLFGAGYLVTGLALDRAGLRGTATAFLGAGLVATAGGVWLATADGSDALVGALLAAGGAGVGVVGARLRRRATTWAGAAAAVAGLAVLLTAPFGDWDDVAPPALVLLALGAAAVLAAPRLASLLDQGDEPPEPR